MIFQNQFQVLQAVDAFTEDGAHLSLRPRPVGIPGVSEKPQQMQIRRALHLFAEFFYQVNLLPIQTGAVVAHIDLQPHPKGTICKARNTLDSLSAFDQYL